MRVAAVNPPFMNGRFSRSSRSPAIVKSGTMYWPFWMAYAVGMLERNGHQVLFLDCPAANISSEDLLEKLRKFKPEITLIDTSTPSIHSDLERAEEIKSALPDTMIFLMGTHASAMPEEVLREAPFITGIARGRRTSPCRKPPTGFRWEKTSGRLPDCG